MLSAILAAEGIRGSKEKHRSPSNLQAREEEEQILMEPEQLQPVGVPYPRHSQSRLGKSCWVDTELPPPCLAGRVERGRMSSSSREVTL